MEALQRASDELNSELGLTPDLTTARLNLQIEIRDRSTGRRYHVSAMPDATSGEVPAPVLAKNSRPPTTFQAPAAQPASNPKPEGRDGPLKSSKPATVVVQDMGAEGPRKRAPATAVVASPPEEDEGGQVLRRPAHGRAQVATPKIRKRDKPKRVRSIPTMQEVPTIDPSMTLSDIEASANNKAPRPPMVNNAALRRIRTIIRPAQGQAEGDSPYFRPVAPIASEASTLIELVDAAVNMAYDHVPCEAVQCLLVEEERSSLYVAAARGTFAREVHRRLLLPPSYIEPSRMGLGPASLSIDQAGELRYESSNGVLEMDLVTALWLPVLVDDEVIAVMLFANSKHRDGFKQGERRGAEYLTTTLGREMGLFLTTQRDA